MSKLTLTLALASATVILASCTSGGMNKMDAKPFSGPNSVSFSQNLWSSLAQSNLVGASAKTDSPYKGTHPHGAVLETITSKATVNGRTGTVVVKRNYGGPDVSVSNVTNNPSKYLKAVTVMFKREQGYDSDNQNWFYAKYKPDGTLHTNKKGMKLAGRVAKGKPIGCIACHKVAPGGDYLYVN